MITSIGEIPTAAAQIYGDKTVLICEGRSLSFSELDALSNKLASALIGLGVQVGDRVKFTLGTNDRGDAIAQHVELAGEE